MDEESKNIAETIFENAPKPITLFEDKESQFRKVVVPNGWEVQDCNDEKLLAKPRRKKAAVELIDTDSFIGYVKRHGSSTSCTIWADIDYSEGKAKFRSIINDHGEKEDEQAWRDHVARYTPQWGEWLPAERDEYGNVEFCDQNTIPHDGFLKCRTTNLDDTFTAFRFGKKASGRMLDGKTWDGVPE